MARHEAQLSCSWVTMDDVVGGRLALLRVRVSVPSKPNAPPARGQSGPNQVGPAVGRWGSSSEGQREPDANLLAHFRRLSQGCRRIALRGVFVGVSVIDGVPSELHQAATQPLQRGIVWQEEPNRIMRSG
jgi:hypothetical protein